MAPDVVVVNFLVRLLIRQLASVFAIVIMVVMGTVPAFARTVDYRIIFIDNAMYAAIEDSGERRRALDYLLADLTMLQQPQFAAAQQTVVFMRGGQNGQYIDRRLIVTKGSDVVQALRGLEEFGQMQEGNLPYAPGLDIQELRTKLHGFLGGISKSSVDVHIFASSWFSGQSSLRNLMTEILPSACVAQLDRAQVLVPRGIEIAIELRAPEQQPKPSPSALASLITLIAGTDVRLPNVLSRGVAGPLCPPQDGAVAEGYDPDPNGSASITCEPVPLTQAAAAYSACSAPLAPSVGPVDRSPVRLIAADSGLALNEAAVRMLVPAAGLGLDVRIGSVAVPQVSSVILSSAFPAGVYASWLSLTPDQTCLVAAGTSLRIEGSADQAMQVVISRMPCVEGRFRLFDVRVP